MGNLWTGCPVPVINRYQIQNVLLESLCRSQLSWYNTWSSKHGRFEKQLATLIFVNAGLWLCSLTFIITGILEIMKGLKFWFQQKIMYTSAVIGKRFLPMGHFQLFSMILKFSMGHFLSFYIDFDGPFPRLMGLWGMAPCLPNHCK